MRQRSAEATGTLSYGLHRSYVALHVKMRDRCLLVLQAVVSYQLHAIAKNI